jgi:hypothetical protein
MEIAQIRIFKIIFYLLAIAFNWFFIFTYAGNYYHGGTLTEHVLLQASAFFIIAIAFKLWFSLNLIERVLVSICAFLPVICVLWMLISIFA